MSHTLVLDSLRDSICLVDQLVGLGSVAPKAASDSHAAYRRARVVACGSCARASEGGCVDCPNVDRALALTSQAASAVVAALASRHDVPPGSEERARADQARLEGMLRRLGFIGRRDPHSSRPPARDLDLREAKTWGGFREGSDPVPSRTAP